MAPKSDIGERSIAMPNNDGKWLGSICMLAWHVAFWMFWPCPSLTMGTSDIRCCGHFPFIPMGMLRFDCSRHFSLHYNGHVGHALFWASCLFIQTGMLRFGWSGHLFPSFKRACCVLVVLGIFSLHEVGHVIVQQFKASFSFIRMGMLRLAIWAFFPP